MEKIEKDYEELLKLFGKIQGYDIGPKSELV
jgi:hypothetical protein